ncbi:copper resistance protein CopC [Actinomadura barringtoniae]|uniref:Copper resistance protein CopC n=1 Tax=Actinomadura barringtoniae TaxID=1427535 RepID=A0A939P6I7_9ACTN|nr:copper resistance protein CopC [Actinomadura barringtoniae]MBO2446278.1 copper resistance protein CopC [Actinomadura barringtoniae]
MMIQSIRRLGVVTALLVALGAVFAAPALAHTRLVSSNPGKDATTPPVGKVELVFSDKIGFAEVAVVDEKNHDFQKGKAEHSGTKVTQALDGALPAGNYTVKYAVVGEDGHRITGDDLKFVVAATESPAASASSPASASAPAATATDVVKASPAAEKSSSSSSGGATWVIIVVGLLIGIGIGLGIVWRAKRKHGPASGGK